MLKIKLFVAFATLVLGASSVYGQDTKVPEGNKSQNIEVDDCGNIFDIIQDDIKKNKAAVDIKGCGNKLLVIQKSGSHISIIKSQGSGNSVIVVQE